MKTALLRNIEAKATGRRVAVPTPIESISFEERTPDAFDAYRGIACEYRIDIRLGATTLISAAELHHSKERADELIEHNKRLLARMIAKHVYGDVREKLFEVLTELYQHDPYRGGTAIKMVHELLDMTEY
jgi:hypothetical protein